jgi:ectoine hydroxylase-related dioxygenase (phytanoyl-CoA dioxygenase family)
MPDLYQYDPLFLDLSNNPAVIPILQAVVGLDLQLTEMIAHNHPADTGSELGNMPQMKKITAPAGTAVIWNVALWHTATANTSPRDRRLIVYGYTHFWVKQWEDRTPAREIVAWADTPQKRQLMGIHAVQGRAAWDRRDVAYLPEHQAIADAKPF